MIARVLGSPSVEPQGYGCFRSDREVSRMSVSANDRFFDAAESR
jgi:hypothetical protein